MQDGIKFLAFLFCLSEPFIMELHKKFKQWLPALTPKQAASVGKFPQEAKWLI